MKFGLFCYSVFGGGWWFRVLGYGVRIIDRDKYPPLFSERNGRVMACRVGKWGIRLLTP